MKTPCLTYMSSEHSDPDLADDRSALDDRFELLTDACEPGAKTHIFNSPEFFRLHAAGRSLYAQLRERKNGTIHATMHFTETAPGVFSSPARGTFGGIGADAALPLGVMETFFRSAEKDLVGRGAREIHITLAPASHDLALFSASFNIFSRCGYSITRHELNYDLTITSEALSERMVYGNRKRLNKCRREGWSGALLEPGRYEAAYRLIEENRSRRGFPVTMRFEDILQMAATFGDRIRFFGLTRESELAAAAICIEVSPEVLYVFYWGDADHMQQYSPVVALAAEIYAFCQARGFRVLDAGTSTVAGVPNHGLIQFKRGLGLRESLKLTMRKQIGPDA